MFLGTFSCIFTIGIDRVCFHEFSDRSTAIYMHMKAPSNKPKNLSFFSLPRGPRAIGYEWTCPVGFFINIMFFPGQEKKPKDLDKTFMSKNKLECREMPNFQ